MNGDEHLDQLITAAVTACRLARSAGAGARRHSETALRLIRHAGQQLASIQRSVGGRPRKNALRSLTAFQDALQRAHITRPTASEWIRIGHVSAEMFEAFVLRTRMHDGPFTKTALFAYVDAPSPAPSTGKRTLRVSMSDREYLTVRRQLETLAGARFADRVADVLVSLVDREYHEWLTSQQPQHPLSR